MSEEPRKKSPRAPSISLDEAIQRSLRVYEKERRHSAPLDIIAQDLGYKNANNGRALAALASLRYYGLLDRTADGKLAVSKDLEDYKFAPSEDLKRELQIKWLKAPSIFGELIEKYKDGLPSDAVLRFELIQRGFSPSSAEGVIDAFKKSVSFAGLFDERATQPPPVDEELNSALSDEERHTPLAAAKKEPERDVRSAPDHDRIPVRLPGGRRAWIEVPSPFFESDKARMKAQIDLLLSDDEDE